MLDGCLTNQEVFFLREGPAVVGALLQKVLKLKFEQNSNLHFRQGIPWSADSAIFVCNTTYDRVI